jgi:formylglycine-generating enzyme required for sulfatase activity
MLSRKRNIRNKIIIAVWTLILAALLTPNARILTGKQNKDVAAAAGGSSPKAGDSTDYTVGGVAFKMHYVPGGLTFPTDHDTVTTGTPTVANAYWIAETDVTYQLWSVVYTWAIHHGYSFANAGLEGGGPDANGSNRAGGNQQPVTAISWQDAIIWCNALTEYKDGNANNCVYYLDAGYTKPLRSLAKKANDKTEENTDDSFWGGADKQNIDKTAGHADNPYIKAHVTGNTDMAKCIATGFRLPTNNEWELAARYKDGKNWTSGNYASGATADYTHEAATIIVGVYNTHHTAAVKSKAPNALGLYDMNGNIWQWCFDWYPGANSSSRVRRGGYWFQTAIFVQISCVVDTAPTEVHNFIGFRTAKSR